MRTQYLRNHNLIINWINHYFPTNTQINNPLGYIMPNTNKRTLVALAQHFNMAIIEDDVYAKLAYNYPRPHNIKSFDENGHILFYNSFSKTLTPNLHIG